MEKIGYLIANIDGDSRYTSILTVKADPNTSIVVVEVRDRSASFGMDGPGGSYDAGVSWSLQLMKPSPKALIECIWAAINSDSILCGYGKATKRFEWLFSRVVKGLSQAKAKAALKAVFTA